jgi:hypothetical protein
MGALSFAASLLVRLLCTLKGIKSSKENERKGQANQILPRPKDVVFIKMNYPAASYGVSTYLSFPT